MNLRSILKDFPTKKIHFVSNIGNAGDGLIRAGLYQLLKEMGVAIDTFYYPEDRCGKILLFMGAGAFCKVWMNMVEPLRYYSSRYEKVYVLPASFETSFPPVGRLLKELPSNVTIFCRERHSYETVRKLVPDPGNVFLEHDLAFEIDVTPWLKKGKETLNVFRTDDESLLKVYPRYNFDLSSMGREFHDTLLLDVLSNFECVNTDRLHVGIAAGMLGKKVRLFRNSYHKIQAVYEHSLHRYKDVRLCEDSELYELLGNEMREKTRENIRKWVFKIPMASNLASRWKQRQAVRQRSM